MECSLILVDFFFKIPKNSLGELNSLTLDVCLEYSKNACLNVKNLTNVSIQLAHRLDMEMFHIGEYSKNDSVCSVICAGNFLQVLEVKNAYERRFLILDCIHEAVLKLALHYKWNQDQFELGYIKTKKRLENTDQLPSFINFITPNLS